MILTTAAHLIVRFGAPAISFTNLAVAIKIAPTTMRRHFPDFHALLGEIMRRHLKTISAALGAVPRDVPDRRRQQRAAYIEATRFLGAPTAAHLILVTYRAILPEDERESVNGIRDQLAMALGGDNGELALHLLDCPCCDLDQIERMLATATGAPETAALSARPEASQPQPQVAAPPPIEAPPIAAPAADHPPRERARPVTAGMLLNEAGEVDYARISGVDIPGGPLGAAEPYNPPPWDRHPSRLLSDAELQRLRAKPKPLDTAAA